MGDIVNLGRARKQRARSKARAQADANAVKHGETKAERAARQAREALERRRLDGCARSDAPEDDV